MIRDAIAVKGFVRKGDLGGVRSKRTIPAKGSVEDILQGLND